jgi:hypothetical protein
MTIADLLKDLIDTAKERLKTPISGAFLWSFLIYNWRPITELFFSKLAIEDRIYIIDQEYCKPEAIYWPLGIALFYTVVVPYLMWLIDWPVVSAKKIRLAKVYENKTNILKEKIKIAEKILELKNVESGNKQISELQDQINTLEESKTQIIQANKNTVNQLNEKLEELNRTNEAIRDFSDTNNSKTFLKHHNAMLSEKYNEDVNRLANGNILKWEKDQILSLKINKDGSLDLSEDTIQEDLLKKLKAIDVISIENDKIRITNHGKGYLEYIKKTK